MTRWIPVMMFCTLLLPGPPTGADGMMVPRRKDWNRYRERAYINEPEQKAAILFRAGREDLFISPSYDGAAGDFAWIVPVPARPRVSIIPGALFHELARLTVPPPGGRRGEAAMGKGQTAGAVRVLERRTIGAYDISVLESSDAVALLKWLQANGYYLPEKAAAPVAAYVHEKWTFVACRIKAPGAAASGLRTGTLAPLRLSFPTNRPVYPMRLSAANPRPFDVLVYLLLPESEVGGKATSSLVTLRAPDYPIRATAYWRVSARPDANAYPTLAKISGETLHIYMQEARSMPPENCRYDFAWSLPGERQVAPGRLGTAR